MKALYKWIAVLIICVLAVFFIALLSHSATLYQTIQLRRATAAQWTATNPILKQGEPGYEYDTLLLKIGDGLTSWAKLPYYGALYGLSQSSNDLTIGSKTFVLPAGLGFVPNMVVMISDTADATKYMSGSITTYNKTTGNTVINVTAKTGTGTGITTWAVWLSSGPTGPAGPPSTITVGTVTTGDPGSTASVSLSGTSPTYTMDITLPAGATGTKGDTGTFYPFPAAGIIISDGVTLTSSLTEHDGYIPFGVGGVWTSADALGSIKVSDTTLSADISKTVTVSGSPYVYEVIIDAYHGSTGGYHYLRMNGDAGNNYSWSAGASYNTSVSSIYLSNSVATSGSYHQYRFILRSANLSGSAIVTTVFGTGTMLTTISSAPTNYTLSGMYGVNVALSSLSFGTTAGTVTGKIYINRIR